MTLAQYFLEHAGLPSPFLYQKTIKRALYEDLGRLGDITTDHLFDPQHQSTILLRSRTQGVLAGLGPALFVLYQLDPRIKVQLYAKDGDRFPANFTIACLQGSTRALLTAERTLLNLLGHLCGIATLTRRLCDLIQHTGAKVLDTRKTLPGLRSLQKYATYVGGARNHRLGLDDCILIKDNHIAAFGSLPLAVDKIRKNLGHTVKVEVEVDNLEQFQQALSLAVDIILLDNMTIPQITQAIILNQEKKNLEVSGGVTEENIQALAQIGIRWISVGALTHSASYLDVGFDMENHHSAGGYKKDVIHD